MAVHQGVCRSALSRGCSTYFRQKEFELKELLSVTRNISSSHSFCRVRDTLLRAAEHGLYRVHWSQKILDETTKNLVERGKMTPEKAQHLVSEMAKAFPEALVVVPEEQIRAMRNDPKDRHVAACAVCAPA
jgi:polyhydroxyalkanoate synthesis regulator phasin